MKYMVHYEVPCGRRHLSETFVLEVSNGDMSRVHLLARDHAIGLAANSEVKRVQPIEDHDYVVLSKYGFCNEVDEGEV
jgi:hypothetical protein